VRWREDAEIEEAEPYELMRLSDEAVQDAVDLARDEVGKVRRHEHAAVRSPAAVEDDTGARYTQTYRNVIITTSNTTTTTSSSSCSVHLFFQKYRPANHKILSPLHVFPGHFQHSYLLLFHVLMMVMMMCNDLMCT